jgi:hypothetical protein
MKTYAISIALLSTFGITHNVNAMLGSFLGSAIQTFATSDSFLVQYARSRAKAAVQEKIKSTVEDFTGFRPILNPEDPIEVMNELKRREQKQKEREEANALREEAIRQETTRANLYRVIQQRNGDCPVIARNLGWEEGTEAVIRIKRQIFNSEPALETIERWDRLYRNTFDENDREWAEQLFIALDLDNL